MTQSFKKTVEIPGIKVEKKLLGRSEKFWKKLVLKVRLYLLVFYFVHDLIKKNVQI